MDYKKIIRDALAEDIGPGDITTSLLFAEDVSAEGIITAEEDMVLAGVSIAVDVFRTMDPQVEFEALAEDGTRVGAGTKIVRLNGSGKVLLTGERVALNFLQRLSGIATLSRSYADAVADLPVHIVDTRKMTPGLRGLEKYAIRVGGCSNHRYGLFDGILIKENHIALTSGIEMATSIVREKRPHTLKIEVEVRTLEEVKQAIRGGADIIMLDNMSLDMMRDAVNMIRDQKEREILIEASGGMSRDKLREVASTGIDIISVGALTHSARWVNISMDIFAAGSKEKR